MPLQSLPIDDYVPSVVALLARHRAVVVTAAPGVGKTTRIPPAVTDAGPVIVLQPRRVAARAIARRIASEREWTVGEEVGWQIRFERRFTARTRLLIVTEGILTARLQSDPLLSSFATVVIDEFHERSIHADLALALTRQAWRARADLRIVVMSATLDVPPLVEYLGGCPHVDVPGRAHRVAVEYAPARDPAVAVQEAVRTTSGDVLAFFPGASEIDRAMPQVASAIGPTFDVLPLHGSLDAEAQDRVFAPAAARRVVLATNIAETSITVPRITAVVDTGLHKVARYDPARGIDSLNLERVTLDAADQRAGRAGRVAPGLALRLWDARDRLRPHREPEIARVDLAAPVLDIYAWGGDPFTLEWFETPPEDACASAARVLQRLGAIEGSRITALGRRMQRLPLHPRLARIILAAEGAWEAIVACAALSERTFVPEPLTTTPCDLLSAVDRFDRLPPHVQAVARQIERLCAGLAPNASTRSISEGELRHAIFAGYPDRVAARRAPGSPRLLLASGTGAVLGRESGVIDAPFVAALDVRTDTSAQPRARLSEARVRIASAVEREWLLPTSAAIEHRLDDQSGIVRATEVLRYDALTIGERPARVDPAAASAILADVLLSRGPSDDDRQLLRRLAFAGMAEPYDVLIRRAVHGTTRMADVSLASTIPREAMAAVNRLAPVRLSLPTGRSAALEYRDDGSVTAAVKLQELFGLAETPRVGPKREPVLLQLLAPNGRPVQATRDLKSFWKRTYPEVRKELRGRYPRHPWPEDPWTATPTARSKRRAR